MENPINIKDKVILVTGAYGLIGKEITTSFLRQGANVVLADIDQKNKHDVQRLLLDEISEEHYLLCDLDITDEDSARSCIKETCAKFGKIDVLINNAAIDAKFDKKNVSTVNMSRFENYPVNLIRNSVEVNLIGTIIMTQAACRQMLVQKHGNIVNVASTYSVVSPNQNLYDFGNGIQNFKPVDYVASKSFIPNFTRYIATFYAKDNIRCNAIIPHGIFNNHDPQFLSNFSKMSPLGRMCNREELNGPFTFLVSDASSYMTGAMLMLDGGWTAW